MTIKYDETKVVASLAKTLQNVNADTQPGALSERGLGFSLSDLAAAVPTAMHYRIARLENRISDVVAELKDARDPMLTDGTLKSPRSNVREVTVSQLRSKLDFLKDLEAQKEHAEIQLRIGKAVYRELVGSDWRPPLAKGATATTETSTKADLDAALARYTK